MRHKVSNKIVFFYGLNNEQNKERQRIWKQRFRMENGRCLLDEGIYDGNGELIKDVHTNFNTGLDFIPAKVIVNDGTSGDLIGESDVAELEQLQKLINAIISDDIDALKFNMFPCAC